MSLAKRISASYQLLQVLGLIAMLFTHWGIALGAFIIVFVVYVLNISNTAKGTLAGIIGGATGIWGYWMFPYLQPVGHVLGIILGVMLVLGTILILRKGE
jgi:hypothetical protein